VNLFSILSIAVALALDAFAVSVSSGIKLITLTNRHRFRLSWHFGLFQTLMTILGWSAGSSIYNLVEKYSHWIAFTLLFLAGIHMLSETFHKSKIRSKAKDPTKGSMLIMLSVATSIDALTVGFSMSMLKVKILFPALIIGFVALLFTLLGLQIGHKINRKFNLYQYSQIIGGLLLIFIGLNILFKHVTVSFVQ
jgi:putative Mn2+ efflux pump MntP